MIRFMGLVLLTLLYINVWQLEIFLKCLQNFFGGNGSDEDLKLYVIRGSSYQAL